MLRTFYLLAAILGAVLPYVFFTGFILEHGFSLPLFVGQLFATDAASGFTADLLVSSAVFWVFLFRESRSHNIPSAWLYVVANLLIGLSFALPLFLYARESRVRS